MKSFNVGASFERIALDILGPLLVQGKETNTCFLMFLSTFQDICLYQCRICRDFEFDKRFQCERHMLEQHSGYGYKCSLCNQVFNRPDNHKSKCLGATFSTVNRKTGKFTSSDEQEFSRFKQNLSALINRVPRTIMITPEAKSKRSKENKSKAYLKRNAIPVASILSTYHRAHLTRTSY